MIDLSKQEILLIVVGFGSVILGGVISSATSWWVQSINNRYLKDREDRIERNIEMSGAFKSLTKLLMILNGFGSLKAQIDKMFEGVEVSPGGFDEPWKIVRGFTGLYVDVQDFDAEDIVFLIKSKESSLSNDLFLLRNRYIATVTSLVNYAELHETFVSELAESPSVTVVGTAVSVELTEEQMAKYGPMEAKLNNLIGQVIESLEEDVEYARRTTEKFSKVAKTYFGSDFPDVQFVANGD